MSQLWKSYEIEDAIQLIQWLYIDHYPFIYKPIFHWVVIKGVLRVRLTKSRHFGEKYLSKFFPFFLNSLIALISLCSILTLPREYLKENPVVWKDVRFWAWSCAGGVAALLGFTYRLAAVGDNETVVRGFDQYRSLELEICQGNQIRANEFDIGVQ